MLLNDYAHECTILKNEKTLSDEGGWKSEWVNGDTFTNHMAINASSQVHKADSEAVQSEYSGLIDPQVKLYYGDYFRDEMTGITYHVTNIPDEKQTPKSASFAYKYFEAERKEVPS